MYTVLLRTDRLKSEHNIKSRFYGENDTREAFFMHRLIVYSKTYSAGLENNGVDNVMSGLRKIVEIVKTRWTLL